MASDKVLKIIESVKELTVLDLSELVKALEGEFGVSAAAPMAMAAAPVVATVVEEQTEFTVVLKEVGAEKIKVIKVVREVTGLGLKEAKDLVDGAPNTVKESVTKDEASTIQSKFKEIGATIEIK